MQGVVCLGLLFRGAQCAHPFCERKCANAAVGLKHLAALKTVEYHVFLMLLSITAMLKLLLRGATRWMSFQ